MKPCCSGLPLPLAQLYRRAHNAKTYLERHNTAFYCWEASLKLLACGAIVEFAEKPTHEPHLVERLTSLARPSLGHWWEFARRLLPVLADHGDAAFAALRDLLLGKTRDDLPRCAGLDASLRETLDGKKQSRATVNVTELFDRLVRYRNQEIGHGASGRRGQRNTTRLWGRALLAAFGELLGRLDCLAGRRLLYAADVRRQATGTWLVERSELVGESSRRIESLLVEEAAQLPVPERIYLEAPGTSAGWRSLHPLILFQAADEEVFFLSARRGRRRTEYLGYSSGTVLDRPDLGNEHRALLSRLLGMDVGEQQAEQWAERCRGEEPAAEEPPGPGMRQVGEFELLSELGRGGMGIVYRAWQPSLGRQVAVKKLQRIGDAKAEARFAREIGALGRVEHPHLVKIFTSGAEGEHWFYTMELVEGATLAAVCEGLQRRSGGASGVDIKTWLDVVSTVCEQARQAEKPLSESQPAPASISSSAPMTAGDGPGAIVGKSYVRQVVALMSQVAEAAHALHEAGILHRDIKPGNILVTQDGREAILMDLGLAQLVDDVEGRLTRTRQFVGTLRYASPQQVLAVAKLDRRADVYSLGATLWEILALRPMFGATDQTPTPLLMEQIQRDEPERLSAYHPDLPRDLEAIVHKCLEKSPTKRYATAHDLARDLQRFLAGEPVRARPVKGWERAWKWVKRHPATAAVYGLAILVALLGLLGGSGWWLWQEAVTAQDRAETALAGEKAAKDKADIALQSERQARLKVVEAQRDTGEALTKEKKAKLDLDAAQWQLRRLSYLDRIQLAWQNWQRGQVVPARDVLAECDPSFRNWEWHHLHLLTNQELHTLRGHGNWVMDVVFSPDGRRLASGSDDGTAKVWDATTGRELITLQGQKLSEPGANIVRQVQFSPDGTRLVSANLQEVIVWDLANGKQLLTVKALNNPVDRRLFTVSPDGKRLACRAPRGIQVLDLVTGKSVYGFNTPSPENDLQFSPSGQWLGVATTDNGVFVLEANTSNVVAELSERGEIDALAWHPESTQLAYATAGSIKLWQTAPAKELLTIRAERPVSPLFSPDGQHLAASVATVVGSPDTIKVWRVKDGQEVLAIPAGDTGERPQFAFSPDGTRLAVPSRWNSVKVWDLASGKEIFNFGGHTNGVVHVSFDPSGLMVASASKDGTVKVWPASVSLTHLSLRADSYGALPIGLSPDGHYVAGGR